jgi:hypothetical protein
MERRPKVPPKRYAGIKCKVMLPSSATERNAATFGDYQGVCKVSSTPQARGDAVAVRSGRCPVRAQGSKVRGCRPSRRCMKSWRAGAVTCALRRDSEHCPFQPCRAQLLALCGPICGRRYRLQDPVGHSRTGYASSGEERNRGLVAARRRFLTF